MGQFWKVQRTKVTQKNKALLTFGCVFSDFSSSMHVPTQLQGNLIGYVVLYSDFLGLPMWFYLLAINGSASFYCMDRAQFI